MPWRIQAPNLRSWGSGGGRLAHPAGAPGAQDGRGTMVSSSLVTSADRRRTPEGLALAIVALPSSDRPHSAQESVARTSHRPRPTDRG